MVDSPTARKLEDARRRMLQLAGILGAPPELLPTFGSSEHTGRPHVEADGLSYHYVVCERGKEYSRQTMEDLEGLLYWALRDAASTIASNYELAHRNPREDFRRARFRKWGELLSQLDPRWGTETRS